MKQGLLDKLKIVLDAPQNSVATLSQVQCEAVLKLYEAAVDFDVWATRHNYPRGDLRKSLDMVEIS